MRRDVAGLRTWLLVALGAWALTIWAATLLGLGGRLGSAGDGAGAPLLPAVPRVEAALVADASEAMARPLFAGDRRPHPFFIGDQSAPDTTGSVRLTGVLMTPGLDMATLTTEQGQSLRLRLGAEPQAGWQLLSLQPRGAVVSGPAGTLNLELQVYNGAGGQMPVDLAGTVPASASANPAASPPVPPPLPNVAAEPATPSAEQIQKIRERIQARRRQAQQNQNGSSGSPKP